MDAPADRQTHESGSRLKAWVEGVGAGCWETDRLGGMGAREHGGMGAGGWETDRAGSARGEGEGTGRRMKLWKGAHARGIRAGVKAPDGRHSARPRRRCPTSSPGAGVLLAAGAHPEAVGVTHAAVASSHGHQLPWLRSSRGRGSRAVAVAAAAIALVPGAVNRDHLSLRGRGGARADSRADEGCGGRGWRTLPGC
eukprot:354218-Chlamydomonas_euryale.AAC.2